MLIWMKGLCSRSKSRQLARRPEAFCASIDDLLVLSFAAPERDNRTSHRRSAGVVERFASLSIQMRANTPAEFGAFVKTETEKWRKIVRVANIKPE
jgi:hypothetical protein